MVGTLHRLCYIALDHPPILDGSGKDHGSKGLKEWNEWVGGRMPAWQIDNARSRQSPDNASPEVVNTWGTDGERLLAEVGVLRARMTPPELWPPEPARFHHLWCEFKDETGWIDFTDLLERGINELEVCPGDPAVLMADEAQDYSALEWKLLRQWARHVQQLVVVADQDQCIFAWRGASPEALVAGPAASERTLARSWRVPRSVHAYSVRWIQQIPNRHPVEYLPRLTDHAAHQAKNGEADSADPTLPVAEGVVERSAYQWDQPGPLAQRLQHDAELGTVAILTACQYMLFPLLTELRAQGVPFHNPLATDNGAWNPLAGCSRLLALLRPDPNTWGTENRVWTWPEIHSWVEPLRAKGVTQRGAKTLIEAKALPYKQRRGGGDRFGETPPPADLNAVLSLFEPEAAAHLMDIGTPGEPTQQAIAWWLSHLRATHPRKGLDYGATLHRKRGGAALRETPRITVGTIHSSKGGEWDTVHVMPDISRAGYYGGWDTPGPHRDATVRQFYVAFTRARERLVLGRESGAEYVQFPNPEPA